MTTCSDKSDEDMEASKNSSKVYVCRIILYIIITWTVAMLQCALMIPAAIGYILEEGFIFPVIKRSKAVWGQVVSYNSGLVRRLRQPGRKLAGMLLRGVEVDSRLLWTRT